MCVFGDKVSRIFNTKQQFVVFLLHFICIIVTLRKISKQYSNLNQKSMKKSVFLSLAAIVAGLCLTSCGSKTAGNAEGADSLTLSGLNPVDFASDSTGLYVISNKNGMEVCFTNFGGRIVSIMVPDKDGNMTDVCLGHDNIADYELPRSRQHCRLREVRCRRLQLRSPYRSLWQPHRKRSIYTRR